MEAMHGGLYELALGGLGMLVLPRFPVIDAEVKGRGSVILKTMLILQEHRECGLPPIYYLQLQKGQSNSSISH